MDQPGPRLAIPLMPERRPLGADNHLAMRRWRRHLGHVLEGLTFGVGAIFVAEVELDIMAGSWEHRTQEVILLGIIIALSWGRSWAKDEGAPHDRPARRTRQREGRGAGCL